MTALPKKKHTRARSNKRRGKSAISLKSVYDQYSKAKGREKKLSSK